MILGIVGVSGFLGTSLCTYAQQQGHIVRGTSHNAQHLRMIKNELESGLVLDFDAPCPGNFFAGCDAVVHCQHDTHGSMHRNLIGTRTIREGIAQAGVPRQLFISAHSARMDALSEYGKTKYALEQEFLACGYGVARPGRIVGTGGSFARTIHRLKKASFIPLPDNGTMETPLIGIHDLCTALLAMLESPCMQANLFLPVNPTLRELNTALCLRLGIKPHFMTIPTLWVRPILRKLVCSLPSPESMQHLATLHLNTCAPVHKSTLLTLVPEPHYFPDLLDEAFETS